MKILFITENFPPETNAAATRVYERALYWVKWGHDVTVITCAPNFPHGKVFDGYENRWRQLEIMDGIRVVRMKTYIAANRGVGRRTLDFLSFLVTGTIGALREPKPDVVTATSPQFFAAVAGWLVGKIKRRPFVFELGDLWPVSIEAVGAMKRGFAIRALEKLELFLYRQSAAVVALTNSFKQNLTGRGIGADKINVVINGVDLSRYQPRGRDQQLARSWALTDKFVVGYVGTHGMAHGLGNVLDAAELLRDTDRIRFVLVGAGAERDTLIEDAKRRELTNVVFIPPQPKAEMPGIWSLCDVALVHLKNNPVFAGVIPSKIFEAMAMGLPILLAAPSGEASTIVDGEHAGISVPAENPDALAEAVRRLASGTEERTNLAQAALNASERYSREQQAAKVLNVYQSVCAGRTDG